MVFSEVKKKSLIAFFIFVFAFELLHISIAGAPPMAFRMSYIVLYLLFCFSNIKLIPIFTAINLIVERFSTVYGEFLPNAIFFHILLLFICYLTEKNNKTPTPIYYAKADLLTLSVFAIYVFLSAICYGEFSLFNSFIFAYLLIGILKRSDKKYITALINCIIIAMALSCVLSFINYENLIDSYLTSSGEISRMDWKDANYLSFFIGIITLIALFKIKHMSSKADVRFYTIVTILLFISLLLLISRGTLVALAIACLIYYKKYLFSHKVFKYSLICMLLGGILYSVGLFDGIIMRFASEDIETGSGRTEIWKTGFNTFLNKDIFTILFGAGNNQAIKMSFVNGAFYSPHNTFIEIFFNFGFIGLVLFLIWWGTMLFSSKTPEKSALIIFIMVNSITIVPLTYVIPIWIIIPLIILWDKYINKVIYE